MTILTHKILKTLKRELTCILLVDDDEPTNFLHGLVIKKSGIKVHVQPTFSGEEALEYLTSTGRYEENGPLFPQPGIIFLDINMPGLSGWEFLEEYDKLSEEQRAEIVVAMLTTSLNPDDETKAAHQKHLSGFLRKPLTQEMVIDLVQKHWPESLSDSTT